ncbi:MAG: FAD-dependent oxidoreductase, partial [Gammaproteobacteria bacterium]|nr:FAD-dependent oxidoreductase [Gammaproteobacteria bacterium]
MSEVEQLNMKSDAFQALFTAEGLQQLDVQFLAFLHARDAQLHQALLAYRQGEAYEYQQGNESLMLIDLAVVVQQFITVLFDIEKASQQQSDLVLKQDPIFVFKKEFVLKRAKRKLHSEISADFEELNNWLNCSIGSRIKCGMTDVEQEMTDAEQEMTDAAGDDRELAVARFAVQCLQASNVDAIEKLTQWCVLLLRDNNAQQHVKSWVSFHLPEKLNYANLVTVEPLADDTFARYRAPESRQRQRDGFALTDARMQLREVLDEIHYCVYCHKNDGDFCSQGFPVKRSQPDLGLKMSPTGEVLTGCPLEEKISEMHVLKKVGQGVAALAMIMRDNPMCAATGHRICNDCMKACIYQKQQPVDIPQVETRVLTDVLELPWGVEIYDLLTRWNPLRQDQYCMQDYNGKKVLVMGMGPAGFTLAHHLTMAGCAVVGADGLKIEPLDPELLNKPIRNFADLKESLDDRVMAGFGGVAEYGITVRWDKNFLKLIYICLMRRPFFQVFGGVRFGGTLTVENAWDLGFDHIALAVGAGLPKELPITNSLAPGMRQANDFLMALQLTGAAKKSSLANLQIRMPAVVIGGGLTGVDAATEVQAYYIKQVEKISERYQTLVRYYSELAVREQFNAMDLAILDEFLQHADVVAAERLSAQREKREPDFIRLLRQWGGVSIVYRRSMQESPAYRRNHEELQKALEEGIYYAEGLEP